MRDFLSICDEQAKKNREPKLPVIVSETTLPTHSHQCKRSSHCPHRRDRGAPDQALQAPRSKHSLIHKRISLVAASRSDLRVAVCRDRDYFVDGLSKVPTLDPLTGSFVNSPTPLTAQIIGTGDGYSILLIPKIGHYRGLFYKRLVNINTDLGATKGVHEPTNRTENSTPNQPVDQKSTH